MRIGRLGGAAKFMVGAGLSRSKETSLRSRDGAQGKRWFLLFVRFQSKVLHRGGKKLSTGS